MTRGGARKGAGRPKKPMRETKAASLSGVRVTEPLLTCYRIAAGWSNMTLSEWVTDALSRALLDAADFAEEERPDGRDTKMIVDMVRGEAEASASKRQGG